MKILNFNTSNYFLSSSNGRRYAAIALITAAAAAAFYYLSKLFSSAEKPFSPDNVDILPKTSTPSPSPAREPSPIVIEEPKEEEEFHDALESQLPEVASPTTSQIAPTPPSALEQLKSVMRAFGKSNNDESSLGDLLFEAFLKDSQSCTMTQNGTDIRYNLVFPSEKTLMFSHLPEITIKIMKENLGATFVSWIQKLLNTPVTISQELSLVVSFANHSTTINFQENGITLTKTIGMWPASYSIKGSLRSIAAVTDLNEHPGCRDYRLSDEDGPFVHVGASHDLPQLLFGSLPTGGPIQQSLFVDILKDNFLTPNT